MTADAVYIGVDVTAGARPMTVAVLDGRLNVERLMDATLDETVGIIRQYDQAMCCIDAPIGPNMGLLADKKYRQKVGLEANKTNYATYRVGEYELRKRGIGIYNTSTDEDRISDWVRTGWELYERLRGFGFVDFPQNGMKRMAEIHPHAAYTVMVGKRPYPKQGFDGLLQRQLLLYENGIDVKDVMGFLNEWTRHHLMRGEVDTGGVHSHDQLDALVAAYTAYLIEREPGQTTYVGDPSEGLIVLPVAELKDEYE